MVNVVETDEVLGLRVCINDDVNTAYIDIDFMPLLVQLQYHDPFAHVPAWYNANNCAIEERAFTAAVNYFMVNSPRSEGFRLLNRWARIFLGATSVISFTSSSGFDYYACDSDSINDKAGTSDFAPDDKLRLLNGDVELIEHFVNGEVYSFVIESRTEVDCKNCDDTHEIWCKIPDTGECGIFGETAAITAAMNEFYAYKTTKLQEQREGKLK